MIDVFDLKKSFSSGSGKAQKQVAAVRGVTFSAPDGEITAIVGPNGAGKTTTLRMIATLVRPDGGSATVDGLDSVRDARVVCARLGVLSDARGLYTRLTARENIRYYGRLRGMSEAAIEAATENLAEIIEMRALLDRRTEGFSQGERMKVAIARALVHDPNNLVLDEPSNGLDIMSTRALRSLMRHLRAAGKCILMSSHIMQEVAALSDRIVILAHGHAIASGTPDEITELSGTQSLEDAFVSLTTEPESAENVDRLSQRGVSP